MIRKLFLWAMLALACASSPAVAQNTGGLALVKAQAAQAAATAAPSIITAKQPSRSATTATAVMSTPPVITITGASSCIGTVSGNVYTCNTLSYGGIVAGQVFGGAGVTGTPTIAAFGTGGTTGTGGVGTYQLSTTQGTIASQTFTTIGGYTASTITSPARVVALSSAFKMTGTPSIAWNIDGSYQVPTTAGGTQSVGKFVVWEWWSDAAQIELLLNNYGSSFDLYVDDQLVQTSGFTNPIGSGQRYQVKLDWSADAQPRKARYYRLAGINLPFGGLYLDSAGIAWFPSDRANRQLLVGFGDSYLQGVGAASPTRTAGAIMAAQLGMDYWVDGLGGSTWNTASPNDALTREQTGIKLLNRKPNYVVAPFGYNSNATSDFTAFQASETAWIQAVKQDQPQAKIVIFGPWTPLGTTPGLTNVKAASLAVATAQGVPFVDIEAWVNPANKALYTGTDNVHPTNLGHEYLGRRMAIPMAGQVTGALDLRDLPRPANDNSIVLHAMAG